MHRHIAPSILALALGLAVTVPAQAEYTFRPFNSGGGSGIGTVNGIVKGDGAGNPSAAVAGTDYVSPALTSGRIYVGSAGNLATGVPMGGDCTIVAAGTITCTKINGVSIGTMALQNANAVAITGGTVAAATGTFTGILTAANSLGANTQGVLALTNSSTGTVGSIFGNSGANSVAAVSFLTDGSATSGSVSLLTYNSGVPGTRLFVNKTGNVGIGTVSPGGKLEVSDAPGAIVDIANFFTPGMSNGQKSYVALGNSIAANNGFYLAYNHDSTAANRYFGIAPNESGPLAFNITAAGNVGIGTTAPAATLDVQGGLTSTGTIKFKPPAGIAP